LKEEEEEKEMTKKGRLEGKETETDSELKKTRIGIPGLY
jgi:hypothetical protein